MDVISFALRERKRSNSQNCSTSASRRQHDHEWVVGLLRQQFRQKTVQIHRRERRFGVGDPQRQAGIIFFV
jgi:hypothetical protein